MEFMFDLAKQPLTDILLVVNKFMANSETATLKYDLLMVGFDFKKKNFSKFKFYQKITIKNGLKSVAATPNLSLFSVNYNI
jgi:hypothetical protein